MLKGLTKLLQGGGGKPEPGRPWPCLGCLQAQIEVQCGFSKAVCHLCFAAFLSKDEAARRGLIAPKPRLSLVRVYGGSAATGGSFAVWKCVCPEAMGYGPTLEGAYLNWKGKKARTLSVPRPGEWPPPPAFDALRHAAGRTRIEGLFGVIPESLQKQESA